MDLHSILNRVIERLDPANISRNPAHLYATFQDASRECAIGNNKSLHFLYN